MRQQALEEKQDLVAIVQHSYSEAAAYVLLLIRVDWHLEDLADLLEIGRDALKQRLRASGLRARVQPTLFDGVDRIDPGFEPKRRVRWIGRVRQGAEMSSQSVLWA